MSKRKLSNVELPIESRRVSKPEPLQLQFQAQEDAEATQTTTELSSRSTSPAARHRSYAQLLQANDRLEHYNKLLNRENDRLYKRVKKLEDVTEDAAHQMTTHMATTAIALLAAKKHISKSMSEGLLDVLKLQKKGVEDLEEARRGRRSTSKHD